MYHLNIHLSRRWVSKRTVHQVGVVGWVFKCVGLAVWQRGAIVFYLEHGAETPETETISEEKGYHYF